MSSQEVYGKGAQGKIASKNILEGPETRPQQPQKQQKYKNKGRYRKKKLWLTRKKGKGHKKCAQNIFETVSRGTLNVSQLKEESQLEGETCIVGKKPHRVGLQDKEYDSSSEGSDKIKEAKSEIFDNSGVKALGSEEIENILSETEDRVDTMESSPQSGDHKNKLLEMMSREFNSGSIQEGAVSLDPKKSSRAPRITRKRKSEVVDVPDKTSEILASHSNSIATVSPIFHNPITSALKKIRKESLENLPSPAAPVTPGRTRRSTQERKSGSEKDNSEEVAGISEPPEVMESKTEEVAVLEKTPDTRRRKRARERGRSLIDGEEGNDSGNESPVIPVKGRGKTQSSSEEDSLIFCTDSPSSSKSRAKNVKIPVEIEASCIVGQIKVKGKIPAKDEPDSDFKGRSKQKGEGDRTEDQQSVSAASVKSRKITKPIDENINPVSTSISSVGSMSTRSKVKTEPEKEASVETESVTQARRSTTPVRGEITPQAELKRSQRILLSREGSSDSSLPCKKGTQKSVVEVIKKPDTPTPPAKPLPTRPKKDDESLWTKTGKKKKKHFKGLSYSFHTKKKKGKGKIGHKQSLDTSQETDSVVSEEIDIESVDSSSQDVPSEQLSNQDQDGIEDRLSEGGDNDVEMDSVETLTPAEDNSYRNEGSIDKISDLSNVEGNSKSSVTLKIEIADSEGKLEEPFKDSVQIADNESAEDRKENADKPCETKSKQICSIQGITVSKISTALKLDSTPAPCDAKLEYIIPLEDESKSEKSMVCEEISKAKSTGEAEGKSDAGKLVEGKPDVSELIHTENQGKGMRTKKALTCLPVSCSPSSHISQVTVQKQVVEKDHSSLPSKALPSPEISCSVSESAFSPGAESEVHMPEEGGDETLKKRHEVLPQVSDKESLNNSKEVSDLLSSKPDPSLQTQPLKKKLFASEIMENDCKTALSVLTSRDPLVIQDETVKHMGKRRQSISKKKMDDLAPEGHNSDSSDSMSESRLPGEGVRKSKRLSRHSSPHGISFAAPESPERPGKGQSKPLGSQSAYVTPASSGEHLCYSILSPPVNLTQSCQQQGNVKSAAPALTNVLCKCRMKYSPLAIAIAEEVYCQAIDSFDGRMIGCCNIVTNNRLYRVSGKIPFLLLCDNHRQRLRRHNCCPCCGLFCTQGVFYECSWDKEGPRHYYHKLCSLVMNGTTLCPHCGSSESPQEVHIELMLPRRPVVYLKQHQERKELSARMTWSKKDASEEIAHSNLAAESEPSLELRNGRIISAVKLPFECGREKLQEAIRCICEGKFHGVKPTNKGIYLACKQNDTEKLLQALVSGLSPNVKVKECGSQTGLHVAAAHGSVAALHILVMAGATIDMTDNQLMTPLMIAITKEQNDVVHYLVQAGASLMAKTQDGMTCLHLAAKCGNLTACQHILDSGRLTRHAVNMQDEGGWTPLVWASENRFTSVVKFLLDRGGNPQLCDVEQNTALHWAAFSGSTQICSMVLDRGCSLRSMNAHGDTPLHIAARQNHTEAVVLLLTRGALLDVLNSKNQTPIDCALPDSDIYLQLTLNSKVLEIMKQNNIRTEKILSSDIAGGKEEVPIPCVNGVDEDELPKDYLYIAENCEASNVTIDRTITSLKWCECEDGCNAEHCGCGQLNFQCWFDPDGRLLPEFNYADPPMIFECNRACRCNKLSCNNRVVQHGISAHMQLFKTLEKGWGVRALKTIQKGSYVCEYVGEIITDLEADQRQDDSYLFDLDNRDSETFCIDARSYGNIARFINHLCEANLTPVKVFIDHQDLTFPRIALFANRDIEADEELGFDYGEKFWMIKYKQFTCTCNSEKCKYSSETIHTTLENYNRKLRELQETLQ